MAALDIASIDDSRLVVGAVRPAVSRLIATSGLPPVGAALQYVQRDDDSEDLRNERQRPPE